MGPRLREAIAPEDVWQETLLYVWRDRKSCERRGIGPFRRWVLCIAENRLRSLADRLHTLRRGGGREPARLDSSDGLRAGGAPPPVGSTTPSRIVSFSEQARLMHAALGELPHDLRDVVRLPLFEELAIGEAARDLHLGVPAVKHCFRKGAAIYHARLTQLLGSQERYPGRFIALSERLLWSTLDVHAQGSEHTHARG